MKWFWVFALMGSSIARDYDKEINRQRQELDALRSQVEDQQKELSVLKAKKSATLEELEKLSSGIAMTAQYIRKLEIMEIQLSHSMSATEKDLSSIQERLRIRSHTMARRVRMLYIQGKPEWLLVDPGREDGNFFRCAYWVKRVLRYDRNLVEQNRLDQTQKKVDLERLTVKGRELEEFQKRKQLEMRRFTSAQTEQEKTLHQLQRSESAQTIALRQLEENSKLLTEIIRTLEKKRKEERNRKQRKVLVLESGKRYLAPVEGPIVSRYGLQYHSTLRTSTRNLGIEIEAKPGTPVRASVAGEVALITAIPGYGMGVILDNGSGYFTIYANLSGIKVAAGETVKTGQTIATVAAQPGKVYFEVRQGTRTLDPSAWLKSGAPSP